MVSMKKMMAGLLVLVMVLEAGASELTAEPNMKVEVENATQEQDWSEQEEDSYIIGEDQEKRDRFTKHFLTEAGNYMAAVYENPVHYEKDGKWEEIDNTLELLEEQGGEGKSYGNAASDVNIEIAKYSDTEELVSIESGEGKISWGLVLDEEQEEIGNQITKKETEIQSDATQRDISTITRVRQNVSEFVLQMKEEGNFQLFGLESGEISEHILNEQNSNFAEEGLQKDHIQTSELEALSEKLEAEGWEPISKESLFIAASEKKEGKTIQEYNAEQLEIPNLMAGGIYKDILPGIDIQYILDSVNIKENIIIKTIEAAQEKFTFRVYHPDMDMVLEEDGSITLKRRGEETIVPYTFMKPYMYDSAGKVNKGVLYELVSEGENTTILSIHPDMEWLLSERRCYPVTIDPVTETTTEIKRITDTFIREGQPTETANEMDTFMVGNTSSYGKCRALIKFNGLPTLSKGDLIYKGILNVFQNKYETDGTSSFYMAVHKILDDWDENVTWNVQPSYSDTILAYHPVYSIAKEEIHALQFDITSLVRDWYNKGTNYGVALTSFDEAVQVGAGFMSSENTFSEETFPRGIFYYKNTAGLEEYWAYHEQDVGRAGHGYVNDFNGNLVFMHNDFSTTGNRLPVSISHVYNLCEADVKTRFGNGWRLNVTQQLEPTGIKAYPYVYTDGDGTKHFFSASKHHGKLMDEDGLGLTVTQEQNVDNYNEYRIITCKDQSKMVFDIWGYLRRSIDPHGNSIQYIYGPNTKGNYLKEVVDPTGAKILFSYNAGYKQLTEIREAETGRSMTFQYDSQNNLISITYPDDNISHYFYEDGSRMAQVQAPEPKKYTMEYTYIMDYQVARVGFVQEYGSDGSSGRNLKISYKNGNNSTFEYTGLDGDIDNHSDNPVYHYNFDNYGRPAMVCNDEGDASSYSFYKDGAQNNKLSESGSLQKTINNYLGNPGFGTGDCMEDDYWYRFNYGASYDYHVERKNDIGYSGDDSVYIEKYKNVDGRSVIAQDLDGLEKGVYTLSAYIKTKHVAVIRKGECHGATIGIDYRSGMKANQTIASKDIQTGTSEEEIDGGWQRITVTFDIPEDDTGIRIWGGLNNANGSVWLDCFQLERGGVAESWNMINNSGFEHVFEGSNDFNVWSRQGLEIGDGCSDSYVRFGEYSAKITGRPDSERFIQQIISVSGDEGDIYSLSGWAKANAVPGKTFQIGAEVCYTDGSSKEHFFEFNPYLTDWQFTGGVFSTDDNNDNTTLSYSSIIVRLYYSNQCNAAWYDGIQLLKDQGVSYVYDDNGNLVSAKTALEQEGFKSDINGNLIGMTTNIGTTYSYGYDDANQNLMWARNSAGISQKFTYDKYGNPTSSFTIGYGTKTKLKEGTTYYIMNKASGKALEVCNSEDKDGTAVQQYRLDVSEENYEKKWKLVACGEYWKIVCQCGTSKRILTVSDGEDNAAVCIWQDKGNDDSQLFKIKGYSDGGVRIFPKVTGETMCLANKEGNLTDGTLIINSVTDENNNGEVWYLETTGTTGGFYTSQTYTEDGRNILSATDIRGNVTTYHYDSDDRLVTGVTDACNITTTYEYDENDRVSCVSRPHGEGTMTNSYTYDSDKLSSLTHNGFSYDLLYDQWGNTSQIKIGNQKMMSSTLLPANGPVSEQEYGNGDTVGYGYNEKGRVTEVTYNDNTAFYYKYDSRGRGIESRDVLNDVDYFFKYDLLGRPIVMTTTHGQKLQMRYDEKSRMDKVVSRVGEHTTTTEYLYGESSENQLSDVVYAVKIDDTKTVTYDYNDDGLLYQKLIGFNYLTRYMYESNRHKGLSPLIRSVTEMDGSLRATTEYEHDAAGNITNIFGTYEEGIDYTYDEMNQLIQVDDQTEDKKHVYSYDLGGNLIKHSTYDYGTENLISSISYVYGDANWKDKLTAYDGQTLNYDEIGNPLTWRDNMNFTWQHGRELQSYSKGEELYTYGYNKDGYRIKKQTGDTITTYYLNGSTILSQTTENDQMDFFYDENGYIIGFKDNGEVYYYAKNIQGDITGILMESGVRIVEYRYDAWGKLLSCTGEEAETLGIKNPFRYRGYYYDNESGLYYLNGRYYDPVVGRFLNADSQISGNIQGANLYSYCYNNPVNMVDSLGNQPLWAEVVTSIMKFKKEYLGIWLTTALGLNPGLFWIVGFFQDESGVYHARQDCWQQAFGYNDVYDFFFDLGTHMLSEKFPFKYKGTEYILWMWKGDYWNLGAGAELGIYYGGEPHWYVDTNLAMTMSLWVEYKGKTIISYQPEEYQWWLTGFNPWIQWAKAEDLRATYRVMFRDPGMFWSFEQEWGKNKGWRCQPQWYTAIYTF